MNYKTFLYLIWLLAVVFPVSGAPAGLEFPRTTPAICEIPACGWPEVLAAQDTDQQSDADTATDTLHAISGNAQRGYSTRLIGPVRIRDLSPFDLQRLDMRPAMAAHDYPEGWALELNFTQINTFVMSDNFKEYLEAQGADRHVLGRSEADALLASGEDMHFFDGSLSVLTSTVHYAFNEGLAAYVTLPLLFQHGGWMDSMIESFHDNFGFSDQGRPLMARDQFQALISQNGDQLLVQGAGKPVSLADPVIGLRKRDLRLGEWDVVLESALKLPIGNTDELFSSGHADLGVQVSFQRRFGQQAVHINLAEVWNGGSDDFAHSYREFVTTATFAYERLLGERWTLIGQLSVGESGFANAAGELGARKIQATLGFRRFTRDGDYLMLALTENIKHFNNTPDIGFHVGYGWVM